MSYKQLFKQDYNFGIEKEKEILPILQSHFGDYTIKKTKHKYHAFDFESEDGNVFYELKTRTSPKNSFPTTMVGSRKVDYANKFPDKTFYFVFNFSDQLCYIKYNKELFNSYEWRVNSRRDRNVVEIDHYVFINTEDLITIK